MSADPSNHVILTIKRRSVTLTPDQMESLAAEYYGIIAEAAGGDDDEVIVTFANPAHGTGFSRALESFRYA